MSPMEQAKLKKKDAGATKIKPQNAIIEASIAKVKPRRPKIEPWATKTEPPTTKMEA